MPLGKTTDISIYANKFGIRDNMLKAEALTVGGLNTTNLTDAH